MKRQARVSAKKQVAYVGHLEWNTVRLWLLAIVIMSTQVLIAQIATPLSDGWYRIPYDNGTQLNTAQDHLSHSPKDRVDLFGIGGGPYAIVAAADGWIEYIDDSNTGTCLLPGVNCGACNNYVWIRHANGEWTKYTHFQTGSVVAQGHQEDDFVTAGTILGVEGDIGATLGSGGRAQVACNGNAAAQAVIDSVNRERISIGQDSLRAFSHLHWEVAIPNDVTAPFDTSGGFVDGINLIPIMSTIAPKVFRKDSSYTAEVPDPTDCFDTSYLPDNTHDNMDVVVMQASDSISTEIAASIVITDSASVVYHAGDRIRLTDGFHVTQNAYFRAEIGACNTTSPIIESTSLAMVESPRTSQRQTARLAAPEGALAAEVPTAQVEVLPERFELLQNFPNPFNPSTTIKYALKHSVDVNLKIFNLLGQEVRSLVDEYQEGGWREVVWDGKDRSGNQVASGQYFYRITAGRFVETKRMVIVE